MQPTRYECDCDTVIDMEQMGVGVEEILQYARGILTREELVALAGGIQEILDRSPSTEPAEPVTAAG